MQGWHKDTWMQVKAAEAIEMRIFHEKMKFFIQFKVVDWRCMKAEWVSRSFLPHFHFKTNLTRQIHFEWETLWHGGAHKTEHDRKIVNEETAERWI